MFFFVPLRVLLFFRGLRGGFYVEEGAIITVLGLLYLQNTLYLPC